MADEAEISLVADAKVFVGGTITDATLVEFEDVARFYVEIKGVTEIGEFGDEAEIATIDVIAGARKRKKKGTRDAGTLELTVARDPLDLGQQAMRAAEKTKSRYAIKIVANDAPEGGEPTVHYLAGYVASAKNSMAAANDFIMTTFSIAIDAEPLTVEAVEAVAP